MIIPDNPNVDPAFVQKVYDKFHRGEPVFGVCETMEITRGTGVFSTPELEYKLSLFKTELNATDVLAERLKRVQEQLRGMRVALINQEHHCYMFLGDEKHHSVAKLKRIKERLKKHIAKIPSWRTDNRLWMDYQDLIFLSYLTKRYYFLKFEEQRLKKQRDKKFERIYRTNPFR